MFELYRILKFLAIVRVDIVQSWSSRHHILGTEIESTPNTHWGFKEKK